MSAFSPEQINAFNQEAGQLEHGDVWSLTRAQLVTTLRELMRVQPEVAFTRDDLVGYHRLQYGIREDFIDQTIALSLDSTVSRGGEYGERFYEMLPKVIGQTTVPAAMQRIIVGGTNIPENQQLDVSAVKDFLELKEIRDQRAFKVLALYPAEGYSLKYRGRQTRQLGELVLGMIRAEVKVSTAMIDVDDEDNRTQRQLLVATQEGHNNYDAVVEAISRV